MILEELLKHYRENLSSEIRSLATIKLQQIDALGLLDTFISSATTEAAYGDSYSFFGRMRTAAEKLPEKFETLDTVSAIKEEDRRIQPYLRSQLFIALIAELEDYLAQLLLRVLEAYPQKIKDQSIQLKQILELSSLESVIKHTANLEVVALFYASPKEYRKRIEIILSIDPSLLEPVWVSFTEMKARRDIGLHNQWQQNEIYKNKVREVGGVVGSEDFLGINSNYFNDSLDTAKSLVEKLCSHCEEKFQVNPAG